MRSFIIWFVCICSVNELFSQKVPDKEFQKEVLILFETNGIKENFNAVIDNTFKFFKKEYPTIDKAKWEEIKGTIDLNIYLNELALVYMQQFSYTEIKELNLFFNSPIGKKYTRLSTDVGDQSYKIGKKLGNDIGKKISQLIKP